MKAPRPIIRSSVQIVAAVIVIFLIVGLIKYAWNHNKKLIAEKAALETTLQELQASLALSEKNLQASKEENIALIDELYAERKKIFTLDEQVKSITTAVGTLEKISKTDKELLQKYSKVYFLNEHYIPSELAPIDTSYLYNKNTALAIHAKVWPYLKQLLDDAVKTDINLQIISAYRSFDTQAVLKSSYKVIYGAGTANQFSADQGYSEHQLGTTVDFTTPEVGATFTGFDGTSAYTWLTQNAHKYGFVLSYPKGNTYYQYEPWHWRYVGRSLAARLHADTLFFYDMDQRSIDTYLVRIFE